MRAAGWCIVLSILFVVAGFVRGAGVFDGLSLLAMIFAFAGMGFALRADDLRR
ncbi:hypothetical protein [Cryobacterium fucosi]|uniref:hypothetical protein n=1 Tax=Cryobacterium fucosi TaxID=1259157 RepID=UPI00141AE808|nr:hypothetical protein [Cryobacterium fucosi]